MIKCAGEKKCYLKNYREEYIYNTGLTVFIKKNPAYKWTHAIETDVV